MAESGQLLVTTSPLLSICRHLRAIYPARFDDATHDKGFGLGSVGCPLLATCEPSPDAANCRLEQLGRNQEISAITDRGSHPRRHESRDGRVVKALDLKSNGIFPRRFESCSRRYVFLYLKFHLA